MKGYRVTLLLLSLCILAGGCSRHGHPQDTKGKQGDRYEVFFHDVDVGEGAEFLDIVPEKSGYLLLTGKPGVSSSLLRMDEKLELKGKETESQYPEKATRIEREGEDCFAFSMERVSSDSIRCAFYRNGTLLGSDTQPGYAGPGTWKTIVNHGMMFALNRLTGALYANGEPLGNVIEETENRLLRPVCFLKSGGDVLLVVTKALYATVHSERNDLAYRKPDEVKTCLLPLVKSGVFLTAEEILAEAQSGEIPETRDCVSSDNTIYMITGSTLRRMNGDTVETLCDLLHFGLSSYIDYRRILPTEDGHIVLLGADFLAEVREKNESSVERQIITLGTVGDLPDWETENAVALYNRKSSRFSVGIKCFRSIENLNLAIASNDLDGILSDDILVMRNYAQKGMFVDLEDAVPELFQSNVLFDNLVDATRMDGICYFLPRSFQLYQPSAPQALLQGKIVFESYNACADLLSIDGKAPLKGVTQRFMLRDLSVSTIDYWIDWSAGTAQFDSLGFQDLLAFCKRFARDNDEVWANDYSRGIFQITQISTIMDDTDPYGNTLAFPKLPGFEHASAYAPTFCAFLALNNESKAAASSFMRFYFGEYDWIGTNGGAGNAMRFSLIREETRTLLFPPEDSEGNYGPSDTSSDNTAEKTWRTILESDHYRISDENELYQVVFDEGVRYLEDQITVEKATEYIQNRISILLAEKG